jgi:adenylate cyclase
MLHITVSNEVQQQTIDHAEGPIEFGRGPQVQCRRCIIEDLYVSRNHLRVEELPGGLVRVANLSQTKMVNLTDGTRIVTGTHRDLDMPVHLILGKTRIDIVSGYSPQSNALDRESLMTINRPIADLKIKPKIRTLKDLGESPAADTLTQWFENVITLQRSAIDSTELYNKAAEAMVDLIGLDLGMVLLRRGEDWAAAACKVVDKRTSPHFSRTLVNYVAAERRTFFQDLKLMSAALSLANVDAAVVSPIFGQGDDVIGALYGVRTMASLVRGERIGLLEAQVVQLLAAAVGANAARAMLAKTRVQFEQFFSPELVRELERDPNLLEGRFQEVTVLFSDLRGFTALAEKLGQKKEGAQECCRLIRDMMERLSARIVDYGGVIVDYAGDGILAMWNAPVLQEDHAALACRAALAMQGEMPGLNATWQKTTDKPLCLGIGLNTGPAQVGNTGSSRKFKYGPHGHTVNLASRVQDATKKLGAPLLITDSTRKMLNDNFITRQAPPVELPGVKDPVVLYELHDEVSTFG